MKKEYVWKIHLDNDGLYHCERYPIVYQNDYVIYFKVPGSKFLDNILRENILEYKDRIYQGRYLTEPPEHIKDQLGRKLPVVINRLKSEIKSMETTLNERENTLNAFRRVLSAKKEELANLEGMRDS